MRYKLVVDNLWEQFSSDFNLPVLETINTL